MMETNKGNPIIVFLTKLVEETNLSYENHFNGILSTMVFTISFCNSLLKQFKTVCFPGLGAGSTRPALRWRGPGRGRGEPGVHSGLSQRC